MLACHTEVRLIGESEALRSVEWELNSAARSDAKVLITGETGVGKEVVARLIHQRSARAGAPLVTLNCAGLPDSLLESELFGHVRGSFTGAYRDKPGLLETAPNGTVFLDEVGEMSLRMQAVLLRFLETGEIQALGADRARARVNVRLITATNRCLATQISRGASAKTSVRLNVVRLSIPPLRERIDDISLLVQYFLSGFSRAHRLPVSNVSADAMDALIRYQWPGNVRELKNVIERSVLKAEGRSIRLPDLPLEVRTVLSQPAPNEGRPSPPRATDVDALAKAIIEQGESFWAAVYPLFMARDLTREDLRRIVQIGLERSAGSYRTLIALFNMDPHDYKRFLAFLRKHNCQLPFQRFRLAVPRMPMRAPLGAVANDRP